MNIINRIKREFKVYRLILGDRRTPRMAKFLLTLAIFYAVSPVDLIPDFIPVIGFLDDLLIIPGLVILALRFAPNEVVDDCRLRANAT